MGSGHVRGCHLNFGAGCSRDTGECFEMSVMTPYEGMTSSAVSGEPAPLSLPFLPQEECQNYVRVLTVTGRKVLVCGTNAFSPVCSSRQVRAARGAAGGEGRQEFCCPHTPPCSGAAKFSKQEPQNKPQDKKGCPVRVSFQ